MSYSGYAAHRMSAHVTELYVNWNDNVVVILLEAVIKENTVNNRADKNNGKGWQWYSIRLQRWWQKKPSVIVPVFIEYTGSHTCRCTV